MSILTILFMLFTVTLFGYLIVLRREFVFIAKRKSAAAIVIPVAGAAFIGGVHLFSETLDEQVRGIFAALIVLSYLLDGRGMTEDRFVVHPLDNRGVKFLEVDRVVLFHDAKQKVVKINFFRFGLRGPLLKFNASVEEIIQFLTSHLKEGTPIDVVLNQGKS